MSKGNLTLSWPLSASGFALYYTPSLLSPVVWSPVTNLVVNQNGTLSVTLQPGGSSHSLFFRLTAP